MRSRSYSNWWIAIPFVLGFFLIWLHLKNPVSRFEGLFLEVGAGLFLFATLFVYERRLVERTAETVFRKISNEQELADFTASASEQGDFLDKEGPVETAKTFLVSLQANDIETAWKLTDTNFQVCRIQAWAYNHQSELDGRGIDVSQGDLLDLWKRIEEGGDDILETFLQSELKRFKELIGDFSLDTYQLAAKRRILGPHHELVQFLKMPPGDDHGIVMEKPTLVEGPIVKVVVSNYVEESVGYPPPYAVAALNSEVAPVEGWPPTFWVSHDPVAVEVHAGLNSSAESPEEEQEG